MPPPIVRAAELARQRPAGWVNDEHLAESLVGWVIETYSDPGGRVMDPFVGSGATLVVAERLGRQAVGVELLPDRVALVRRRIGKDASVVEGDALELDRMALGTFDLCLTSPPYMSAINHPENPLTGYQTTDGHYGRYIEAMERVFASIARCLSPNGTLVLNVANVACGSVVTTLADDLTTCAGRHLALCETIAIGWDEPPSWLMDDRLVVLKAIN